MAKPPITFENYIRKIISYNCEKLKIKPIKMKVCSAMSEVFSTPTTQSSYRPSTRELYINKNYLAKWQEEETPYNMWLTISHECRHAWQAESKDYKKFFDNYERSENLSVAEYNAQIAEIDAWAWAIYVVQDMFGVAPTLEQIVGKDTAEQIQKRINEIKGAPHPRLAELSEIRDLADMVKIKDYLEQHGYSDVTKNKKLGKANLQDIARAEVAETDWLDCGNYSYKITLHQNVRNYETYEWIWAQKEELFESDEPFGTPHYAPASFMPVLLYAKEIK